MLIPGDLMAGQMWVEMCGLLNQADYCNEVSQVTPKLNLILTHEHNTKHHYLQEAVTGIEDTNLQQSQQQLESTANNRRSLGLHLDISSIAERPAQDQGEEENDSHDFDEPEDTVQNGEDEDFRFVILNTLYND